MSTWTNSTALALLLAACVPIDGGSSGVQSASILDGAMTVTAPRGYCIDRAASQVTAEAAVMIIGRCSDTGSVPPAAITATIGGAGSGSVMAAGTELVAAFFTSAEGRATLSRDGQADAVTVQEVATAEGAVLLHLTDAAVGEYWRAVFGLRGRLVTLAVTPPEGQPLSVAQGKALLLRAIATLRAANPVGAA